MNEVSVISNVEIDMKAIITVGIARAERKYKEQLKDLNKIAEDLTSDIEAISFDEEAKTMIPDKIKNAHDNIEKSFRDIGSNVAKVTLDINVDVQKRRNEYTLGIASKDKGYRGFSCQLTQETVNFNSDQVIKADRLKDLEKKLHENRKQSVTLRSKLNDFPSLERQIHARVVEQQLQSSTEGKAILEAALRRFEEDTLLLGV